MFNYISKTFYSAAMNGAESSKINPTQAHELIGMACGECEPLDRLVMRLEQSALQQWKDRYACKAVRLLARYIRRMSNSCFS